MLTPWVPQKGPKWHPYFKRMPNFQKWPNIHFRLIQWPIQLFLENIFKPDWCLFLLSNIFSKGHGNHKRGLLRLLVANRCFFFARYAWNGKTHPILMCIYRFEKGKFPLNWYRSIQWHVQLFSENIFKTDWCLFF